jgi:hypothetical protein
VLPDKTYTLKGESWRGLKVNKERISVLVCANMVGSEKFLSIVAGKSKQPCFKNTKFLPCHYHHSKAAWMTCEIFWSVLDRRIASKTRRVLPFVYQCPAHPKDVRNLINIQVEFLPANTNQSYSLCILCIGVLSGP